MPKVIGINRLVQKSEIAAGVLPKNADAIVGTPAQVASGIATHDNIQAAHDALVDGQHLLILNNLFSLTATTPLSIDEKISGVDSQGAISNNPQYGRGDIFKTPSFSVKITEIKLNIGLQDSDFSGDPTLVVEILDTTSGGLPTGTALVTSASVPLASLPTLSPDSFVSFTFSPFSLSVSKTYAFLVRVDAPNAGSSIAYFNTIKFVEGQGYLSRGSTTNFFRNSSDGWSGYKVGGTANGLTVRKRLMIEGLGFGSKLDGVVAFETGSENSIVSGVRFNSRLTLNANQIQISNCWQSANNEIDNNGVNNNIRVIQEE